MSTKAKKAKAAPKRYDLTMIRDFLDHLLWELRTSHYEAVQRGRGEEVTSPELVGTLAKFNQKYGSVLLPLAQMRRDGLTDAEFDESKANANRSMAELRDTQLGALESLQELFAEALKAAECRTDLGFMPYLTVSAREFLDAEPATV
jgi:hypothetical protein